MRAHILRCVHCGKQLLSCVLAFGREVRTVYEDMAYGRVCRDGQEHAPGRSVRRRSATT